MDAAIERRGSFRLLFSVEVICQMENSGRECSGILRDLSINSLFMETDDCPHVDSKCSIDIVMQGKYSSLRIEKVSGTVKRCDSNGVAVCFDERLEWFAMVPLYSRQMSGQTQVA